MMNAPGRIGLAGTPLYPRPKGHAKPRDAGTLLPRRVRDRRASRRARMAARAVFPERRTDDRRPGLDRSHRALARRPRSPRRGSAGAVRRDAALVRDRFL